MLQIILFMNNITFYNNNKFIELKNYFGRVIRQHVKMKLPGQGILKIKHLKYKFKLINKLKTILKLKQLN